MKYDRVILGFAEPLVPLVLDGTKTLTYRLGDRYDFLQPGDRFLIENSATKTPFAEILLTRKERTHFGDLPIDAAGHDPYPNKEAQREAFGLYYGHPPTDDETVLILGFTVERAL